MAAGGSGTAVASRETSSSGEAGSRTTGGPRPAPRGPRFTAREWWHTPRLVKGLAAIGLAAVLLASAVAATVLGGARDGIDAIGHRAAPQAVRAADLYFALSDMDAQAANLLLTGADPDYSTLRKQTLDTYEQRRNQADADLQAAAVAAAADPAGQRAVQTVLGELGSYEALIARAELLEDQAHAPAGKPSAEALDTYRRATELLRQQLLPAADQVTAANSEQVERTYATQRGDLDAGWWWLLVTGLLALVALGALQRLLAVRFRRRVNPMLAAATLLVAGGLVAGLSLASGADGHLVVAKSNAYDSVIALSRARAVAYDMNADESRYLTDPAGAAAYEQSFFDKTQAVARVDGASLNTYNDQLAAVADRTVVPFGGFLGTELRNVTFPGEQDAAERVLRTFQAYQRDDRKIRELHAQGRLKEAVTFNTGTAAGQSNADFDQLSTALGDVLAINQRAFDGAITSADSDLGTGVAVTGGLVLAACLALTVLGVRPRLREYR